MLYSIGVDYSTDSAVDIVGGANVYLNGASYANLTPFSLTVTDLR